MNKKSKTAEIIKKLSFTKGETRVILFLVIVIIAGCTVKYVKYRLNDNEPYNYNESNKYFKMGADKYVSINDTDILININQEGDTLTEDMRLQIEANLQYAEDSVKLENKSSKKGKKETAIEGKLININTATKQELMLLPGIGEATAEKIINYRNDHNGFKKIEDIIKVKGIGKKKFEKIKPYITTN